MVESTRSEIFSVLFEQPTRNTIARELFKKVAENYKMLPFAERWVISLKDPQALVKRAAFRELTRIGAFHSYPVLKEKEGGLVAQAEHTIIVEKDAARVLV